MQSKPDMVTTIPNTTLNAKYPWTVFNIRNTALINGCLGALHVKTIDNMYSVHTIAFGLNISKNMVTHVWQAWIIGNFLVTEKNGLSYTG